MGRHGNKRIRDILVDSASATVGYFVVELWIGDDVPVQFKIMGGAFLGLTAAEIVRGIMKTTKF